MKKKILYFLILLPLLAGCTANYSLHNEAVRLIENNSAGNAVPVQFDSNKNNSIALNNINLKKLPLKVNWPIAFASQAPFGNWALPYQETCEEASLILANKYFKKEKLDKAIMDMELLKLIEWENEKFGYYTDTNVEQVGQIAEQYFNLRAEISADVSVENMKKQLAAGNVILAPAAGRLLHNPHYQGLGPIYHFLLIIGYDDKYFYTNDVGTKRGENYKYDYQTLINAIHDLPFNEDNSLFRPYDSQIADVEKAAKIIQGAKRFLIIGNRY